MVGGIRLPVADIAVEFGARAGGRQLHETQPVRDRAPHVLGALDVAVNDDREQPAGQMARIIPAVEFDLLGLLRVLALRQRRIGVAAVGTDQPVHHQLERRGDLVPVHRRDDHDAMRCDPQRVDLVHPVLGLAERMVRIARARPVAERRRGREAGLARVNVSAVLGRQPGQIEQYPSRSRPPALWSRERSRRGGSSSTSRPGKCARCATKH